MLSTRIRPWFSEFSAEDLAGKPFDGVQPFFLTPKLEPKKNDNV
jgi:hypothetical protein